MIPYGNELIRFGLVNRGMDIAGARKELWKRLQAVAPEMRQWRTHNIKRGDVLVGYRETDCLPQTLIPQAVAAARAAAEEHGVKIFVTRPTTKRIYRYDPRDYEH